jgi:putative acetyltransferase
MLTINPVSSQKDIDDVKKLFFEYLEYIKTYFQELSDFPWLIKYNKDFEKEINLLPGKYILPKGYILLAKDDGHPAGCVAIEGKNDGICEMQRLYIRQNHRRKGIATNLCKTLIEQAKNSGYKRMQLYTAIEPPKSLYKSLGFKEIEPYCYNPIKGAVFMELKLV